MRHLTRTYRALLGVLAVGMVIRGTDYLIDGGVYRPFMGRFDPDPWLSSHIWGWLCIAASLIVIGGAVSNMLTLTAFGCMTAGIVNLMIGVPMIAEALSPPIDDFRLAADYLAKTLIWWIVAAHILKQSVIIAGRRYGRSSAD